ILSIYTLSLHDALPILLTYRISLLAANTLAFIFQSGFALACCFNLVASETVCKISFEKPAFPSTTYIDLLPGKKTITTKFKRIENITYPKFQVSFSFKNRFSNSCIYTPHCFHFKCSLPYAWCIVPAPYFCSIILSKLNTVLLVNI